MNLNELAPMSYDNVVTEIVANANSFTPDCLPRKNELIAFVKNPENREAVMMAYRTYGIPPANRPTKKRWPAKDIKYCDNYAPLQFLVGAKYLKQYPELSLDKSNCGALESFLRSIEVEKVNVDKERLTDKLVADIKTPLVQELNTRYLTQYSKLDCQNYQEDIEAEQFQEQLQKQEEKANKPTTATYFIYGISGVIVLLGLGMLFKKKS